MKVQSMPSVRRYNYVQSQQRFRRLVHAFAALLLCSLTIVLNACFESQPDQSGTGQALVTTPTTTQSLSPTPTQQLPTITLQVVGCPSNLPLNWDGLVGTHASVNKVQKVTCGSLEGQGTLQALINVRYYSPDARLDVYVYDNLAGTPFRRFSVKGLLYGDAQISSANTITTAEMGPKDSLQGNRDLFKEYAWNGTAFVQTTFPALYPDMTRYQADQAEASVTNEIAASGKGPDTWRLSGLGETSHLAQFIFHWSNYSQQIVTNNKRANLTIISVTNLGPGGGGFVATLNHLNGNINNIYEIMQISPIEVNITLTSPVANAQLISPVQVSGSTPVNGSILGQVVIYDDTFTQIGNSGPIATTAPSGSAQFNKSVSYSLNAQGAQEGMVAFYQTNQNSIALSNQVVLVKVLLTA